MRCSLIQYTTWQFCRYKVGSKLRKRSLVSAYSRRSPPSHHTTKKIMRAAVAIVLVALVASASAQSINTTAVEDLLSGARIVELSSAQFLLQAREHRASESTNLGMHEPV